MSVKIGIDNEVIELTGKEAQDFEAQRAEDQKVFDDAEAEAIAKKEARLALLQKLGLTAEEANLL